MAINNNLYPPIVDTYMPAFLKDTSPARIYFSLSAFNVESDIKNIQVSVRNQNTNLTALDTTIYPSEIKIVDKLGIDPERRTDDKYYIEINTIKYKLDLPLKMQVIILLTIVLVNALIH